MRSPSADTTPTPKGTVTRASAWLPLQPWMAAVALVLVTVALYWPATRCGFLNYDDPDYVTGNLHIQRGLNWEGVKWASASVVACNWHPLTVLSHMMDCQVFGLNPWGHHFTSVLLHAVNAVLVFGLFWQMTGATWRSLFLAALFALHPLRVESVAWVAERKDLLSGFFGMLSLICYVAYAQRRLPCERRRTPGPNAGPSLSWPWTLAYLLALCFFVLGLMSKPMLVTWPLVMLLLDYWPLKRMKNVECRMKNAEPGTSFSFIIHHSSFIILEKLPFFLASAVFCVVTLVVQHQGGAVKAVQEFPLGVRFGNALVSYGRYLGKLLWPEGLAVYYPHPGQWPLGTVLLAGGLWLGISALVFIQRRRLPFLLVGWLWFCGTLVPVIGLVQVGEQAMADRYTYLPCLGALVMAVWGTYELARGWKRGALALTVAGTAAVALCLPMTRRQLSSWQNSELLFRHALQVTKDNYLAHLNLGSALDEKGASAEAMREYLAALRLKPDNATTHYDLGVALLKVGDASQAINEYREALRLKPDHAPAHYSLGNALLKNGQLDEAIAEFQRAVRLNPDLIEAHNNLGFAFARKKQFDQAIYEFQEVLRLKPDHVNARKNLDAVLATKARTNPPPDAERR
jgi:protein O-mannosyl-transferase